MTNIALRGVTFEVYKVREDACGRGEGESSLRHDVVRFGMFGMLHAKTVTPELIPKKTVRVFLRESVELGR